MSRECSAALTARFRKRAQRHRPNVAIDRPLGATSRLFIRRRVPALVRLDQIRPSLQPVHAGFRGCLAKFDRFQKNWVYCLPNSRQHRQCAEHQKPECNKPHISPMVLADAANSLGLLIGSSFHALHVSVSSSSVW